MNPDPKNCTCIERKPIEQEKKMMTISEAVTITTNGPFTSVVSSKKPSTRLPLKPVKTLPPSQLSFSHRIAPLKNGNTVSSGSDHKSSISTGNTLQANGIFRDFSISNGVVSSPVNIVHTSPKKQLSVPASYQPPPIQSATQMSATGNFQTLLSLFPITHLPQNLTASTNNVVGGNSVTGSVVLNNAIGNSSNPGSVVSNNATGNSSSPGTLVCNNAAGNGPNLGSVVSNNATDNSSNTVVGNRSVPGAVVSNSVVGNRSTPGMTVSTNSTTTASTLVPMSTGQAYITVIPKAIFYSLSYKKV